MTADTRAYPLTRIQGGTHGDSKAANGGAKQHQEGGQGREAETDNHAFAQTHEDGTGKAGR